MAVAQPAIGAIHHVAHVVRQPSRAIRAVVHPLHVLSLHRVRGRIVLGDEEHAVDGPSLTLLPAGDRDDCRPTATDRAWWALFDGMAVRPTRGGAELHLPGAVLRGARLRRLSPAEDRTAAAWFRELHGAWRLGTAAAGLVVRARLLDLLALWAAPVAAGDAVDRLRERIERTACDPDISIPGLARPLAGDVDALGAAFRARFGVTPVAYRTRQRLQLARELLVHDPQPLAEVARRCGFADAGYLCRVFRQHLGLSPRAYVRRCACAPRAD